MTSIFHIFQNKSSRVKPLFYLLFLLCGKIPKKSNLRKKEFILLCSSMGSSRWCRRHCIGSIRLLVKFYPKSGKRKPWVFILLSLLSSFFPFLFGAKHVSLGRYTFTVIIHYRYACRYISEVLLNPVRLAIFISLPLVNLT